MWGDDAVAHRAQRIEVAQLAVHCQAVPLAISAGEIGQELALERLTTLQALQVRIRASCEILDAR